MKKKKLGLILGILCLAYLAAWPVSIRPVAWQAAENPGYRGQFAENERLRALQRLGDGSLPGPEAVAFGRAGELYTGLEDGRVVRIPADLKSCRVLGNTGGRPLGLKIDSQGNVLVADAISGLLSLDAAGEMKILADHADGIPLRFPDDLDIDAQGRIYFTDASWKFGLHDRMLDVLEHGSGGRLLRYDPNRGEAVALLTDLNFANGVALGPDDAFILINETTAYRVTRFWLKGPKAGTREVFAGGLPGFPDNITFNGRDRFWLALVSPRSSLLDSLSERPFWRTVIARLPAFLQLKPAVRAHVVGLDLEGKVIEQYQDPSAKAFGPVTSVIEHNGALYLGSLSDSAIAHVLLSDLRSSGGLDRPHPSPALDCKP